MRSLFEKDFTAQVAKVISRVPFLPGFFSHCCCVPCMFIVPGLFCLIFLTFDFVFVFPTWNVFSHSNDWKRKYTSNLPNIFGLQVDYISNF